MTEALILGAAFVLRGVVKELPRIIWAIRCPASSAHYKLPEGRGQ